MTEENGVNPFDDKGWYPNVEHIRNKGIEITGAIREEGDLLIVSNNCFHFGFTLVCCFNFTFCFQYLLTLSYNFRVIL